VPASSLAGRYTDANDRYQGFADLSLSNAQTVNLAVYGLWPDGPNPLYSYVDAGTDNTIGEGIGITYASYLYPVVGGVTNASTIYSAILAAKALGVQVWCKFI